MKLERFFEKFEKFADAPNAVERMRELVLQLAVQGRLVAQSSDAEPANTLAVKISNDRAAFVKARSLARQREFAPVAADQCPFDLPSGWLWTRLGNLCRVQAGFAFASAAFIQGESGVPMIRIRDITKDHTQVNYVGEYREEFLVDAGDYLVGMDGSFTVAKWRGPRALLNQRVSRLQWYSQHLEPSFFAIALQYRLSELQGTKAYTTVDHLSSGQIENAVVPLPPLAEQKCIVAKVDELMALCDRLEAQQQERDTRHAALARASLARFAEAPTPANLDFLFHQSYTIPPADLRKSILTLAVQGKLVPQDPNDELADELIARIAAYRRAKKAKAYEPVTTEEAPYEVPFSWSWVRLGNISHTSDSGWSPQCLPEARSGTDWGVLKVSAVSWGVFKPEENKALPPGMTARPDCEVKAGDFLLSRANTKELVARSVVVGQTPPRLMMSDKIVRFTFPDEIEKAFVNLANSSEPARDYYARNASGTSSSMKNIGREVMCNLPIPLPPVAEQRSIVAKVDQLMALVDQLETQLAASRASAEKLMQAVVAELTS